MEKNRRWLLAERPTGPIEDKFFRWVEEEVPTIADGEILVRVLYLSCDPTQRGWISRDTYLPAVKIAPGSFSMAASPIRMAMRAIAADLRGSFAAALSSAALSAFVIRT